SSNGAEQHAPCCKAPCAGLSWVSGHRTFLKPPSGGSDKTRAAAPSGRAAWGSTVARQVPRIESTSRGTGSQGATAPGPPFAAKAVPFLSGADLQELEGLLGVRAESPHGRGAAGCGHAGPQVDHGVAQGGEHLRCRALAHPAGVFPQRHVADVVPSVLAVPV